MKHKGEKEGEKRGGRERANLILSEGEFEKSGIFSKGHFTL